MAPSPAAIGRRSAAHDARADHHDLGGGDAHRAAQQQAGAAVGFLQHERAGLSRHAPGDFAHGRQQRQPAGAILDGLIGDAGRATVDQGTRQLGAGGQVQVGEERVLLGDQRRLPGLRLLHLDDQLGA